MKRYLSFWLVLSGVLLLATATINYVVDPYGLFRGVDKPGFNQIKPKAGSHGAMSKAYQVLRVRPKSLILGNSRAEVGFNPNHASWAVDARPVYNLALPGTGTHTSLMYLQHVLENQKEQPPKVIVWGIDFMDFLTSPMQKTGLAIPRQKDNRLLVNTDGTRNPTRALQQLRDSTEATFSLSALLDAINTLRAQRNPYSEDLTSQGFNPMRDYLKITADEGYWAVFHQKNIDNIKAYSKRPNDIYDASGASSPALDDLRRVIKLCRQHGITLQLVMYPYHAQLLEILHLTEHWHAFENWKRAVVHIAHVEPMQAGLLPIPIWDFSQYNEYTQSAVPEKGDKKSANSWYWEAGHFKQELGDKVLAQVLDETDLDSNLGVRLDIDNVEPELERQRVLSEVYRKYHTDEMADLQKILNGQLRTYR